MALFEVSRIDGERGLRLVGELDLETVASLQEALALLPAEGQARLDLSELSFIDSSGLHAIADFAQSENGSGPVILDGVSPLVARALEITNLADGGTLEIRSGRNVR
jgi:anti-anti-sigma factor